jgi:regulator of replication initiation timing
MQLSKKIVSLVIASSLLIMPVQADFDWVTALGGAAAGAIVTVGIVAIYSNDTHALALKHIPELQKAHAEELSKKDQQIYELRKARESLFVENAKSQVKQEELKDLLAEKDKENKSLESKNAQLVNYIKLKIASARVDDIEALFRDDNQGNTY